MNDFQNNPILNQDLPDFEQAKFTAISKKYLKIVLFNSAVFSVFFLVATGVGFYFLREVLEEKTWLIFLPTLLLVLWIFVRNYFAFFQRKYAVREKDVVYHYGLLKRNIVIVPFNRIQHIELKEGWFSRMLGLKSISVFTAGSEDLTIRGLPKEVAENINQLILNKIKDEPQDEIEEETENQHIEVYLSKEIEPESSTE